MLRYEGKKEKTTDQMLAHICPGILDKKLRAGLNAIQTEIMFMNVDTEANNTS